MILCGFRTVILASRSRLLSDITHSSECVFEIVYTHIFLICCADCSHEPRVQRRHSYRIQKDFISHSYNKTCSLVSRIIAHIILQPYECAVTAHTFREQ